MSATNFILSLARKLLARESKGITTIPNRMAAEQKAGEIVAKLENAGLPLNRADEFIRSEQDLIRILNMIDSTPPVMREVPSGIRSTESAKVFDIKGKEIKDTKNIIGGEEVKETEGAIKSRLEKGNKEAAQKIRMKKMVDDAIDNMSPSLSGDTRTDAVLVAEDLAERMGMVYDDLPIREQTKLYDQAYQGLSNMRFEARQTPKGAPPKITSKKDADSQESSYDDGPADFDPDADNETFATGGRAGFANGSGGLLDILNIQASGSKSGKQQIDKAPEGFTMDDESYNIILNADIPINEKINLLTTYGRDKGRTRIEKDDQELFVGEGGSRIREIGLDFNPDAEKGFGGNIMYDPDRNNVKGGITYKFADGGRTGFKTGLSKKFLDFFKGLTKAKPFSGKEFVDKRKFIGADKIENKIQMMKNKKVLEEARKEFKKNPPFKFPEPGSKEYDEALAKVQRALIEDRKLNADGGRIGYKLGGFKTILNFLNENNPVQAYKKYLQSVKTRAQENPKALVPELAAVASGGIFVNRRMQDILKNMKEKDMENNLENFRKELNKDPFYQKYPDIKDKVLENYTEKMFGEKRADGGRIGYFMGSANPRGLGLLRQILNYMSKKGIKEGRFKGADLSALDMLKFSNPKRLNKLLEDVRGKVNVKEGIMGTDSVKAMQQADREKRKGITAGALEVAKDMKARDIKIKRRIAEEAENTIIPRIKKQFMEDMGMSEEAAEKTARNMAEAAQNIRLTDDPPIITKEGLLQLENVLKNLETGGKKKRDLNADGGRIGFKDGMTRRTFLKIFGGLVSLPIIGKIVKPLKLTTGVKKVPIIKTDNVPGKPEWFDALVNKVIIEGDDVTKRFATKDREIIHAKQIDEDNYVTVTQDLDEGVVRVEYEGPTTMFGDKVDMAYVKPLPDEGNPRPVGEFQTSESGIVGRAQGPDDYDLEIEGMSGRAIEDLESDVSKLKEYATGKKLTMKEIVEAKKRKDKVRYYESPEGQSQYVTERQGEYDYSPDDGMASGGIARMLGE